LVKIYNGFATVRKTTKLIEALVSVVLRTIVLLRFFTFFCRVSHVFSNYGRSVLLLETDLSLWLVLDYGTVCHMTSSRVTRCHSSVVNSKHFYLDSHILVFCY